MAGHQDSFVHLHGHSHYSLLDGGATLPGLCAKAAEMGMPALGLTDHGNLFGMAEFYQEAKKAGIKPLLGCEYPAGLSRRVGASSTASCLGTRGPQASCDWPKP